MSSYHHRLPAGIRVLQQRQDNLKLSLQLPGQIMIVRISRILFSLLITGAVFLTLPDNGLTVDSDQKQRERTYKKLELFSNILNILEEHYVEEIDAETLLEGAINGMLFSLDPHSSYLSSEDLEELQNETIGSYTGVGIKLTVKDNKLKVISPIENTPAHNAGIQANDVIVKINDIWTRDITTVEASKLMRGPKGTSVKLTIMRDGDTAYKEFSLIRDTIPVQSVRAAMIEPGIVYTRITNFQRNTATDYVAALEKLERDHHINAILLDLRNNPGGLLEQAVSVADLFLDSGLIVYTKGRTEGQNMVFKAKKSTTQFKVPLLLLVNEGTASASEIVSGAIQDHKRGIILGTQTFGKGSVQTIIPLPDGTGMRLTTSRYYTPSGRSIQARGITPDVEIFQNTLSVQQKNSNAGQIREADLRNHIENGNEKKPVKNDPYANTLSGRLESDTQLRMALSVLKSMYRISRAAEETQKAQQ